MTWYADALARAHESRLASTLVLLQQTQVTQALEVFEILYPFCTANSVPTIAIPCTSVLLYAQQESLVSEKMVSSDALLKLSHATHLQQLLKERADEASSAALLAEARAADASLR